MKRFTLVLIGLLATIQTAQAQTVQQDLVGLGMKPEQADYLAGILPAGSVLGNNTSLKARNQANSADISILKVDATDDTVLASDTGDVIKISPEGTSKISIATAGTTFSHDVILNTQDMSFQNLSAATLDADVTTYAATTNSVGYFASNSSGNQMSLISNQADSTGGYINFLKTRAATGSLNANTIVASGDDLGVITAVGADGATYQNAAQILFEVDGTPGTTDMPGRITFLTSPDGSATLATALTIANDKSATFTGKVIANANVINVSTNVEAVAGAGTTVADAAALSATKSFHQITGANGTVGWKFPTLAVGDVHWLLNTTAGVAKVYAVSGGTCNGGAADAACTLLSGIAPHMCYATATNAIICS